MEIWKTIRDYPKYQISSLGNIKSHQGDSPRLLKGGYDRDGYHLILLYNEKGRVSKRVHRLVAEAFIPNPDKKPQVNHKDGNKKNNNLDNLEWASNSENITHSFVKLGKQNQFTKQHVAVVQKDLKTGEILKVYESAKKATKNGFHRQSIVGCCRGYRKSHKGYSWSYL
jgi:hypothetical protein